MDPFLAQLSALCTEHVTRNKWVFVPSHAIGRTIGEQIALTGTNWLNLRFVTPLDIAVRMAGPYLVERGVSPSEDGLGPALMMRLLLGLPEDHGYFRPLAEQPSMAQALWGTLRELRMAGLRAADIPLDAFESVEKHAELLALFHAYEQHLDAARVADIPAVYEEAPTHLDFCPIAADDLWTEHPDAIWAPSQRALLDVIPGTRIPPARVRCRGLSDPRRWAMLKNTLDDVERTASSDAARLRFLMRPADAPPPSGDGTVACFRAGGREAEIEEVFRRILSSGAALDQVEIACASNEYATLAWEKACRHEWPVTTSFGLPAAVTRPGRALLAWCDWIDGQFAAVDLRHLLQSGDVSLGEGVELSPGKAARLLARAEATWGRETYGLSLARLAREYRRKAEDTERGEVLRESARENLDACRVLARWIDALVEAVPQPGGDGLVTLEQVTDAAERFVERCCARTSALDGFSQTVLLESIAELHALDTFRCSLGQALGFVRERVLGPSVGQDRPRPGYLHVSRLAQSGYAGRPHLFVVGLEEGHVFPAAVEDPVLLDAERAAISPALRRSTDKIDEAVYAVVSRLAAWSAAVVECGREDDSPARGRGAMTKADEPGPSSGITLSYSCLDTREYRETLPSWLLLQACRLATGDVRLAYDGLATYLGEPVSCVPAGGGQALTEGGWWLHGMRRAPADGRPRLLAHFPQAARGSDAIAQRATDRFTEFDGYAPDAGRLIDPTANGVPVSATTLEAAAKCPQQFFIKRGLRVEPVPRAERDRDAWLDPLTRGAELHDIYAALMRRCRAERRLPDVERDDWIRQRAVERLEQLRREVPPPSAQIFERERRDFLRDVDLFVEYEARGGHGQPVGLEVAFGSSYNHTDRDETREDLARAEPVAIDLGGGRTLLISGRIDRIDRVGKSLYDVIDYKAGGYRAERWKGTFASATRLQHALYGIAATELLRKIDPRATVRQGVYFFTSAKGGQERCEIPQPPLAETREVLADLLDVIATGAFVHTQDEGDCRFCDFGPACGRGAPERAGRKVVNASERRLDSFRRLATHE